MENKLYVSENYKDLCINCETETEYSHNVNIDYRNHYVEGAGQMCKQCWDEIFE